MTPDLIAGRYRLERPVGRGGMGTVWLARDEVLGREVAVKQVGSLPGESTTDTARAFREARASAALSHKNVVAVFDVIEDAAGVWLVMEFVPSRTLGEMLRHDGPLSPERAARIGAQVADGLTAAHEAGTIHRDVKPGNILVGEGDLAKVSDFGIARTTGDDHVTRTGLLTGTPSYFSPELARGGDPDPASDVWALGATLYAAVEGRPPYDAHQNPLALLQRIALEAPRRPTRAGVLAEPIARMMDPDPRSRWAMADAARALHRLTDRDLHRPALEDATTMLPPVPLTEEGNDSEERQGRRRPRAASVAPWLLAAALLAVVAGAGYLLLGLDRSPSAQPQAPASSTEPTPAPSQSPRSTGSPVEKARGPSKGTSKEAFVATYFGTVPQDTDTGWRQLAPSMQQEVGRGDYEDFWGSIDSVEASRVVAEQGEPAVNVVLTYHFSDGRVVTERQRILLERSPQGYRIADDQVLSSRTVSG